MTTDEAVKLLDAMKENDNPEYAHGEAEEILCKLLCSLGAKQAADAFDAACNRVGFYYV